MLVVLSVAVEETEKERLQREREVRHQGRISGLRKRLLGVIEEIRKGGPQPSDRQLSISADTSHGWIATIRAGNSKDPAAIPLALLCEAYGYNVRWVITGLGEKTVDRRDDVRFARERGDLTPDDVAERILAERPIRGRGPRRGHE